MARRKAERKQKDKSYVPKEFEWNPFLRLDNRAKKLPKSLLFAILFCLVAFSSLLINKQQTNRQILGAKIRLEENQKEIYQWEQILAEKPDYRDGWLQLSSLWAQLGNRDKAKEALDQARAVDPNDEAILPLEKLLEQ